MKSNSITNQLLDVVIRDKNVASVAFEKGDKFSFRSIEEGSLDGLKPFKFKFFNSTKSINTVVTNYDIRNILTQGKSLEQYLGAQPSEDAELFVAKEFSINKVFPILNDGTVSTTQSHPKDSLAEPKFMYPLFWYQGYDAYNTTKKTLKDKDKNARVPREEVTKCRQTKLIEGALGNHLRVIDIDSEFLSYDVKNRIEE